MVGVAVATVGVLLTVGILVATTLGGATPASPASSVGVGVLVKVPLCVGNAVAVPAEFVGRVGFAVAVALFPVCVGVGVPETLVLGKAVGVPVLCGLTSVGSDKAVPVVRTGVREKP